MPQISVIVPVYGVEQYLSRCVDSILAQTFSDFELILVDDGSPDNCGTICDEYAESDSRVRVIHKENGGVSKARNAALDVAQGTYISFCDSDDYWMEDYLKKAISGFVDDSIDVVVMNYIAFNETGEKIREGKNKTGIVEYEQESEKYKYILEYLLKGLHGWEIWTRLFRNSIIQDHHIRFCTDCGNYAEDFGFVSEYTLYSRRVHSIEESQYCYGIRSGSMMEISKNSIMLDQVTQVSYHLFQRYEKVIKSMEYRRKFAILHFLILHTELRKIVGSDHYCKLGNEFSKIQRSQWCKNELRNLYSCSSYLKEDYGKRITGQILLFTHYCLHGNWKRFCYESAVAYKWLIAKE